MSGVGRSSSPGATAAERDIAIGVDIGVAIGVDRVVPPMQTGFRAVDDARMDVYVIERFLVGWTVAEVDDLVERCSRAAAVFARRGVRHLASIVMPGDETCLSVFTGPNATAVLEVNADLGLPVGRIQAGAVRGERAAS